jgi:hypothetical protein
MEMKNTFQVQQLFHENSKALVGGVRTVKSTVESNMFSLISLVSNP